MVYTQRQRNTINLKKNLSLLNSRKNTYGLFKDVGESIFYDFILSFAIFAIHFISIVYVVASTTHWFLTIATNSILQNMLSMCASVYVCITVGSASANDAHICHVAKSKSTNNKYAHRTIKLRKRERNINKAKKSNSIIKM